MVISMADVNGSRNLKISFANELKVLSQKTISISPEWKKEVNEA